MKCVRCICQTFFNFGALLLAFSKVGVASSDFNQSKRRKPTSHKTNLSNQSPSSVDTRSSNSQLKTHPCSYRNPYQALSLAEVRTRNKIYEFAGSTATLECDFKGHEQWFGIQWKKMTPQRRFITMATLSPFDDPIFSSDFDTGIKRRLLSDYSFGSEGVTFNLEIHNLQCSDSSMYRCDAMTSTGIISRATNLTVSEPQRKPNINYDVLVVDVNQTFTLRCEGNTDVHSGKLQWFYKSGKMHAFETVKNAKEQLVLRNDKCSQRVSNSINITVNANTNNSVYRCALSNWPPISDDHTQFYDDVVIRLPEIPKKTTTAKTMSGVQVSYVFLDKSGSNANVPTPEKRWLLITCLVMAAALLCLV